MPFGLYSMVSALFRSPRRGRPSHRRDTGEEPSSPSDILKKVRRVELKTRKLVNENMAGEYHSVFKGRGMEFAEVREYQVGDDVRLIDWNVTSRMGHPFVKIYDEEREMTVMLMVDASSSGLFGTRTRTKGELATEISALLAFSAIKNNDRVGLIIFTDTVERFIPPKKGREHVLRVIRELLYFRPESGGTDIAVALEYLNRVLRKKSVVFLISDFLDLDFQKPLRLTNQRHDLVAISVIDPLEMEMPDAGLVELEDLETGDRVLIDSTDSEFRRLYLDIAKQRREDLQHQFSVMNVDFVEVHTHQPYDRPLMEFFKRRARKIH